MIIHRRGGRRFVMLFVLGVFCRGNEHGVFQGEVGHLSRADRGGGGERGEEHGDKRYVVVRYAHKRYFERGQHRVSRDKQFVAEVGTAGKAVFGRAFFGDTLGEFVSGHVHDGEPYRDNDVNEHRHNVEIGVRRQVVCDMLERALRQAQYRYLQYCRNGREHRSNKRRFGELVLGRVHIIVRARKFMLFLFRGFLRAWRGVRFRRRVVGRGGRVFVFVAVVRVFHLIYVVLRLFRKCFFDKSSLIYRSFISR